MEIIDTNNYYPFGLNHTGGNGLNSSGFGGWQSYKYNGKELQETGMYDFGARFYMADLGRWGVIDPLAEQMSRYSPYNYAYNNPVSFIVLMAENLRHRMMSLNQLCFLLHFGIFMQVEVVIVRSLWILFPQVMDGAHLIC